MKQKFSSARNLGAFMKKNHNSGFAEMINERAKTAKKSLGISKEIVSLSPNDIDTWMYRDRKDFELGDIDDLALSIKNKGQIQPIIVVKSSKEFKPKSNKNADYIVIAGYRRWLACKNDNLPVQAVIYELTVEDAVATLVAENEKEGVSDFSKGMFYDDIIKGEGITQDELHKKLGIPITTLKRYLSFARVPKKIWDAVGDLSKVSARTSAEIASLSAKGEKYQNALIQLADKIRLGYGEKRINRLVDKLVNNEKYETKSVDVLYENQVVYQIKGSKIEFSRNIVMHENYNNILDSIKEVVTQWIK